MTKDDKTVNESDTVNSIWLNIRKTYKKTIENEIKKYGELGGKTEEKLLERTGSVILMNYPSILAFGLVMFSCVNVVWAIPYMAQNKALWVFFMIVAFLFILVPSIMFIHFLNSEDMRDASKGLARVRTDTWINICLDKLGLSKSINRKKKESEITKFYIKLLIYHKPIGWQRALCYATQIAAIVIGVFAPIQFGNSTLEKLALVIVNMVINFWTNYISNGWTRDYYYDEFVKILKQEYDL
ncbi:MAG: hypothetical protein VZR24_13130 [Butyrivibrio hungatei]|nr:hypothetical protein [Butyrivibrio hungatei]